MIGRIPNPEELKYLCVNLRNLRISRSPQCGFSLLEVLVAFAILSVSLGVLLQVFATGLRNVGMADDYSRARTAPAALRHRGRQSSADESEFRTDPRRRFACQRRPLAARVLQRGGRAA